MPGVLRNAGLGLLALALGGCNLVAPTRSAVELPGGVVATTPDGYCFDTAASRIAQGFALMAPCASLGEPASDIDILSTQAFNGQVMVHFSDAGRPPVPGLQQDEWRAFTDVNGRLVTIAVRGLAAAPLRDGPGAGLLKLIVAGVQAVSGESPPSVVSASAVEG